MISVCRSRRNGASIEIIGTPAAHKKHVVLEGGHVAQDIRGMFREVLDWLDRYLGPVR